MNIAVEKNIIVYLKNKLNQHGFVYLSNVFQNNEFIYLANELGSCELLTSINVLPNSRTYINKENLVPLHSDCPLIKYVGWHCQKQDEHDGATILCDSDAILRSLNSQQIQFLKETKILYPDYKTNNIDETFILTEGNNEKIFYYAPWLINKDVYNSLDFLNFKMGMNSFKLRLKQGEILFIDNQRMLHGRNAIEKNSQRFLLRVWIK